MGVRLCREKDFQIIRRSRAQAWKCVWSEGKVKINNIENLKKKDEWKFKHTHTHIHKTHRYVGLLLHRNN